MELGGADTVSSNRCFPGDFGRFERLWQQPAQVRKAAQPVTIVLFDFAFTPQTMRLRHGQAYQLRLVNRGRANTTSRLQSSFAPRMNPADELCAVSHPLDNMGLRLRSFYTRLSDDRQHIGSI